MDRPPDQGSDRDVSSHVAPQLRPSLTLELSGSIFPAFEAQLSPAVSPTGARELFVAVSDEVTFFKLLTERELDFQLNGDDNCSVDVLRCVDRNRRTLLHQACRCGNVQVAKCLLFHGADAAVRSREGRTPFHEAAASKKSALELLKLLYEHDPAGLSVVDAHGSHVLHLAAIHGNLEVIRWCAGLVAAPTTKRAKSPRPLVSKNVVSLGITSYSGRNMLHYAAYNGRLEVLQWLLGAGNARRDELTLTALDANGYSVLHYAAMGAPLEVCEWIVLDAPMRHQLDLTGRTSEGKSAVELASARPAAIQQFLAEVSRAAIVPSGLRCLGADTTSLGVAWDVEPVSADTRLWETLKPLYFHLEVCKKPPSLSSASGFLTMLMLMPPITPTSPRTPKLASTAVMSASHLLKWEPLGVLIQPEAREHWLCGLEKDTEYLVRMRARNRNGFSGYSLPDLAGIFTTGGGRRRSRSTLRQFFGAMKMDLPMEPIANTFIGDLHFELLEARNLPRPSAHVAFSTGSSSRGDANKTLTATQGRYYCVISIETPSKPDGEDRGGIDTTRLLYCVRSPLATLQQDLVLAGCPQVWRHPRFALNSVFRVPEAMASTEVTIAVHHETQGRSDSCCVGRVVIPLLDLVQGMPAKMKWLALVNMTDSQEPGGLVLLRTLFLADGISELPHPTLPNTWGSTAEELLTTAQPPTSIKGEESVSPPSSTSSTCSTSSSSSQFAHASMTVDRLGFSVFDPELQLRNGEWQTLKLSSGATRSYTYYQLLAEELEYQQEQRWTGRPLLESKDLCAFDGRELVWRGIPSSRRPELYSKLGEVSRLQERFPPDYFIQLVKRLEDPTEEIHSGVKNSRFASAKRQIRVDLKRTFAGNDDCWISSPEGQQSLERVLLAYALHNDTLGYCQSMTFVVGRLLCLCHAHTVKTSSGIPKNGITALQDEERVFWLLVALCEDLFPSYYTQGMTGLQVDGAVLDRLIKTRLPKLHRHFQQLHAPPMGLVLVTQWLLPLCCAVFPSETTFRLLDVIFLEGSSVVFALAVALLRISQHELLAENVDYTQLFRFLRARDQRLHDAPLLLEIAHDEHQLLADRIEPLRQRAAGELGLDLKQPNTPTASPPADELRPGDHVPTTETTRKSCY